MRFCLLGAIGVSAVVVGAAFTLAQTEPVQTERSTQGENGVRVTHAPMLNLPAAGSEGPLYQERPEWLKRYPVPNDDPATVPVAATATAPAMSEQDKVLAKLAVFPKEDLWNKDISKEPVDPQSAALIAEIGAGKGLHPDWGTKYGIPFQLVDGRTPKVMPKFEYPDESDKGPYPMPANPLIEGVASGASTVEGDRHILCIDPVAGKLYELYHCFEKAGAGGGWNCGSGAIFDLTKVSYGQRPRGWTSADAAGLPVFPGLVRYDEVCIRKELTHAVRFTVVKSRRAYVAPATHWAARTNDATLPPMGMRVRLKAGFDVGGFPPEAQVVLKGLKTYGMILADNGSDWFISGAPDPRWNDEAINTLKKVKGSDLEVVKMGAVTGG